MITFNDRLRGGLYGLLVGDACGVPYEFKDAVQIPQLDQIDMIPPEGFRRSWSSIEPGTWSDDGAQALVLAETLLDNTDLSVFPTTQFKLGLKRWMDEGYMAVGNNVFDIGGQTQKALRFGDTGEHRPNSNGNGSLMRTLPVTLVAKTRVDMINWAQEHGRVTHAHPISVVACTAYAQLASLLLAGLEVRDAVDIIVHSLGNTIIDNNVSGIFREATRTLFEGQYEPLRGTGYVVDSFWSALRALQTSDSYEETIKRSIAFGEDTDTTACIAGGLAGIHFGASAIPARWIEQMRDWDIAVNIADRIIKHRGDK